MGQTIKPPEKRLNAHLLKGELKKKTHKNHWLNKLTKQGLRPEVEILCKVSTESANEKEREYIRYYRSISPYLTNTTDGGEGWSKGTPQGGKNKKGLHRQFQSKPVIGTCKKTGKEIEFAAIKFAEKEGFNPTSIVATCKGRVRSHNGYIWRYKYNKDFRPYRGARILPKERKLRSVVGTNLKTGQVVEFESAYKAQRSMGFIRHHIHECCRGEIKQHQNYVWKYK